MTTPAFQSDDGRVRLWAADCLTVLPTLEAGSVQCVVTSPPYYGLRDYGVDGQIGLESSPDLYIENLVSVFREIWRVLRDDGTLWLNLGDSYASVKSRYSSSAQTISGNSRGEPINHNKPDLYGNSIGLKDKDLMMIPARVALALQADGWYLRSDIIWAKPNPMPESVTDRPTKSHEHIFLLAKQERYYYDAEAISEPSIDPESYLGRRKRNHQKFDDQPMSDTRIGFEKLNGQKYPTRNKRDVWTVNTHPYPEAHFATFPPKLIEPCVLAGSKPGDTILDPFCGSGTTGEVALKHHRAFVGIELNPAYVELAQSRTEQALAQPALLQV